MLVGRGGWGRDGEKRREKEKAKPLKNSSDNEFFSLRKVMKVEGNRL